MQSVQLNPRQNEASPIMDWTKSIWTLKECFDCVSPRSCEHHIPGNGARGGEEEPGARLTVRSHSESLRRISTTVSNHCVCREGLYDITDVIFSLLSHSFLLFCCSLNVSNRSLKTLQCFGDY